MTTISLSLVSHTNVGKTTLARTLLRRDVGEIRDASHVTLQSSRHTLLETATGDALDANALVERARSIPKMEGSDLVRTVTTDRIFDWPAEDPGEFGIPTEHTGKPRRIGTNLSVVVVPQFLGVCQRLGR